MNMKRYKLMKKKMLETQEVSMSLELKGMSQEESIINLEEELVGREILEVPDSFYP